MQSEIRVIGIPGLPEITAGDDLSSLIARAIRESSIKLLQSDILVIAQKIVSKAEGRTVDLNTIEPSEPAREWAAKYDKDPRAVEVVLRESRRIVRMERGVLIAETRHGYVCANAGVDSSNTPEDTVVLLPEDPDSSARRIRSSLEAEFGINVAVIISDTFGRPWREGLVNVALGVAGLDPLIDYRGEPDSHGRQMRVTVIAVADELASAAELVMRKTAGVPAAIIRGFEYEPRESSAAGLIRRPELDLFR
ncbi:MAG TPA: coenzyme F420-0:L-glutamate ligase [Blastocatellia bacterium]|nr:coenzyme F420-0:L-glutamate ligase [Blastocatellia bacterium]